MECRVSDTHSSKEWMSRVSGAIECAEDVCGYELVAIIAHEVVPEAVLGTK